MKRIKFVRDVFDAGVRIHREGDMLEPSAALARHVRRGNAVEVEIAEPKSEAKRSRGRDRE